MLRIEGQKLNSTSSELPVPSSSKFKRMKIILNDKPYQAPEGCTLSDFIARLGVKPQGLAVAIDYEVVPKERWDACVLQDGQELMLIQAVSGG